MKPWIFIIALLLFGLSCYYVGKAKATQECIVIIDEQIEFVKKINKQIDSLRKSIQ